MSFNGVESMALTLAMRYLNYQAKTLGLYPEGIKLGNGTRLEKVGDRLGVCFSGTNEIDERIEPSPYECLLRHGEDLCANANRLRPLELLSDRELYDKLRTYQQFQSFAHTG